MDAELWNLCQLVGGTLALPALLNAWRNHRAANRRLRELEARAKEAEFSEPTERAPEGPLVYSCRDCGTTTLNPLELRVASTEHHVLCADYLDEDQLNYVNEQVNAYYSQPPGERPPLVLGAGMQIEEVLIYQCHKCRLEQEWREEELRGKVQVSITVNNRLQDLSNQEIGASAHREEQRREAEKAHVIRDLNKAGIPLGLSGLKPEEHLSEEYLYPACLVAGEPNQLFANYPCAGLACAEGMGNETLGRNYLPLVDSNDEPLETHNDLHVDLQGYLVEFCDLVLCFEDGGKRPLCLGTIGGLRFLRGVLIPGSTKPISSIEFTVRRSDRPGSSLLVPNWGMRVRSTGQLSDEFDWDKQDNCRVIPYEAVNERLKLDIPKY